MPVRGNLVVECARVLALRLAAGEWLGMLPGERALAELLGVGRDTVRLALQQLEREKVLGPTQAGSKRNILIVPSARVTPRSQFLRIGMLSPRPLEQLSQPMLFEVDHLRRALSERGGSLDLFAPTWYEQKNPTRSLAQLVEKEPCNAWILFRSSAQIQRWFGHSNIPCLIRGYPQAQVELSHLDVDWAATARHASGRLWRQGHQRVGIFIPPEALQGVAAAVKGASELGEPNFSVLEIHENGTVDGLVHALSKALKQSPLPTALIATRARQTVTAMTWLASKGIQVPTHMSIVSLAHEPFLNHLVPSVSGYYVDPETVAKQVIRRIESLVTGHSNRSAHSWITPHVVKGESIAAAR
jgi:DNA-binding LacI/PurR family transcriptional regulator